MNDHSSSARISLTSRMRNQGDTLQNSTLRNTKTLDGKNFLFNCNLEYHNQISKIREFNQMQKKIKNSVQSGEETNRFVSNYSRTQNNSKKEILLNNHHKSPFKEILMEYDKRNYKVPYLSQKHNLFKNSPLLLKKSGLDNYYSQKNFEMSGDENGETKEDKDLNFIERLDEAINEKKLNAMNGSLYDKKYNQRTIGTSSISTHRRNKSVQISPLQKTQKEMQQENQSLEDYNKTLTQLLQKPEFKLPRGCQRFSNKELGKNMLQLSPRKNPRGKYRKGTSKNSSTTIYNAEEKFLNLRETCDRLRNDERDEKGNYKFKLITQAVPKKKKKIFFRNDPETIYKDIKKMQFKINDTKDLEFGSLKKLYMGLPLPLLSDIKFENIKKVRKVDRDINKLDTELLRTLSKY